MSQDDDFGGFEGATITPPQETSSARPASSLPDWLISQNIALLDRNNNKEITESQQIKKLQDELSSVKEQLIDHQASYVQLQTHHRQELEERSLSFNHSISIVYKEFQTLLKEHREQLNKDFKAQSDLMRAEQDRKLNEKVLSIKNDLNEKFENKLADFQENLIKHYESEFEDIEVKVRKIVSSCIRDEQLKDNGLVKQNFERIERDLKNEIEKHVQTSFMNQSEFFKEQIKSGVLQEHLIHKDLINKQLDKLFRTSEEKRRRTNLLFARHMSVMNFFVDNAHKQLGLVKDCHRDMLKNKDIADYFYGSQPGGATSASTSTTTVDPTNLAEDESVEKLSSSLYSLSNIISGGSNEAKSLSKDNLFTFDDQLIDENLLNDI